jgi:hypothetical protein
MRLGTLNVKKRLRSIPESMQLLFHGETSLLAINITINKLLNNINITVWSDIYEPDTLFSILVAVISTGGKIISTSYKNTTDLKNFIKHKT